MAFDEGLASRVRAVLAERTDFREQRMFGGTAFMVNTRMACGMAGDDIMVRVGPAAHEAALARGAREMEMGGRTMPGFLRVSASAVQDDESLAAWVDEAVQFALSQPPKAPKPAKAPRSVSRPQH